MEMHLLHHRLPSCKVGKKLIARIEKRLLQQIPKLLQKDLANMMELLGLKDRAALQKYAVIVEDRAGIRELGAIGDYGDERFDPSTRRISLQFRIGLPEILAVNLDFVGHTLPALELVTMSQRVKKICPQIASDIAAVVKECANPNWFFHSRVTQLLLALLIPGAVVGYGHLKGIDPFFLYSCQGWLFLLTLTLGLTFPRLFPYVSFETRRHFNGKRLLLVVLLALNLTAISGYIGLLAYELNLFSL